MGNETLIEFLDEEDSLTSQLKAFDRSDAERNRLINVRVDSPSALCMLVFANLCVFVENMS